MKTRDSLSSGYSTQVGSNSSLDSRGKTKHHSELMKQAECHKYHKMSLIEIEEKFQTSIKNGLDPLVAQRRLATNGPNKIKQPGTNIFVKIIKYFFTGFVSYIYISYSLIIQLHLRFCGLLWVSSLVCILGN